MKYINFKNIYKNKEDINKDSINYLVKLAKIYKVKELYHNALECYNIILKKDLNNYVILN